MSMRFLKTLFHQQTNGKFDRSKHRVDEKVPFELRIGRTVTVSPDKFIIGEGKLALSAPPDNLEIKAIGYYDLFGTKYYNVHLDGRDDVGRFIQVDSEGREIHLFQTTFEDDTLSVDDWKRWHAENGLQSFKMNDIEYSRIVDQGGANFVDPLRYTEKITNDMFVVEIARNKHEAMLYGRNIEGTDYVENLLAEQVEDAEGAFIAGHVGIMLSPLDLKVF